MDREAIGMVVDWFIQLKVHAGMYCHDRCVEDILENANKMALPFKTIKSIKDAWKSC